MNIFHKIFKKKYVPKIIAYGDWVVIRINSQSEKTVGKIIIPNNTNSMKSVVEGEIISIVNEPEDSSLKVGANVVFFKNSIHRQVDDTTVIVHKKDILALNNQ